MMPAITIWQPWATLIAEGVKPYEFRTWAAHRKFRGQRIAIHAGARPFDVVEARALAARLHSPDAWETGLKPEAWAILCRMIDAPDLVARSAIVCTAILGEPVSARDVVDPAIGDSDRVDHQKFAWPLTKIEPVSPPVPATGRQGFWMWDEAR